MSQAVKVGIFMTGCLVLLAYLILKAEDLRLFAGEGQRVEVAFDSVAGLDEKAAVRVAGVRVGQVEAIRLEDRRARVTLRLDTPVRLTEGSRAAVASLGMLGDKYVELIPGATDAAPLPPEAVLEGTNPISFDQALAKLDDLAGSLEQVTSSLGGQGETSVSRLLDNLEATSATVRELLAAHRAQISSTVANFESLSGTLAQELPLLSRQLGAVLEQVDAVMAENRDALGGSLDNINEMTADLRLSVENLGEISGSISRGEGTLGKLVRSEEAHDQLISALESVESGVETLSDTLGRIRELELSLGFDGYFLEEQDESRTAFSLEIDPPDDRFYLVEIVDDPRGRVRAQTETITVTAPDGSQETTTVETIRVKDEVTFSAQFGFRFRDARLRAGLFESTGGAGIDYGFLDNRLSLSLDAFDFGRENDLDPRLRFTTRWRLHPNVHLLGGYDDVLVDEQRSIFLGAGFRWSDDDLKYLLGSIPRF